LYYNAALAQQRFSFASENITTMWLDTEERLSNPIQDLYLKKKREVTK